MTVAGVENGVAATGSSGVTQDIEGLADSGVGAANGKVQQVPHQKEGSSSCHQEDRKIWRSLLLKTL